MLERARARREEFEVIFEERFSEEEMQFEDYFESDLEIEAKVSVANEI